MDVDRIKNNFSYHEPTVAQIELYSQIRNEAKNFAYRINDLCPDSREKSLAMTYLEQTVMWCNAAIARNS